MSMNLHCNVFEVRQTPSYITEMVLSYNKDAVCDGGMEGVVRRYVAWCNYERQCRFSAAVNDPDEQSWIELDGNNHITALREAIESAKSKGETIEFEGF